MEPEKIGTKILSYPWPSNAALVAFAAKRQGFCGDNGFYGLTYPGDLDDYDRANGRIIAKEMVELSYWDGEIKEILIRERDYLRLLAAYLEKQELAQLAQEIRGLAIQFPCNQRAK